MRVLVLGASGMIGSAMFGGLHEKADLQVWGSLRSAASIKYFPAELRERLLIAGDMERGDALVRLFANVRPEVVINCIGLTKHHEEAGDPLRTIPINSLFPHRVADLCMVAGARMIHVSTDCVFAGTRGNYLESDAADATDLYGKSKHLGEVDFPHAITLRTSTIGHELHSTYGLLEWFLSQHGSCKGYSHAFFSGLTNTEFVKVVRDVVIPRPELRGLYHVGGESIAKYELLKIIACVYGKQIEITRDDDFIIDRSLNSTRFFLETGYRAAAWHELIRAMQVSKQGGNHVQ